MDLLVLNPAAYTRLYNCSWYSVEAVSLEARRSPYLGAGFIALGAFYTLCYAPCAVAISRHLELSCYKLMFALAWCDLAGLLNLWPFMGYFAASGWVFCTSPRLMLINGALSCFFWLFESMLAVVLAFDRCMLLMAPNFQRALFEGRRTWVWVGLAFGYAFAGVFTATTPIFSALIFSYFYNPHVGYYPECYEDKSYGISRFQLVHNVFVVTTLLFLYFALILWLIKELLKTGKVVAPMLNNNNNNVVLPPQQQQVVVPHRGEKIQQDRWEKQVFLQALVISGANAATSGLFTSFQFYSPAAWLVYTSTYGFQSIHGLPGIVYLAWNRTIRDDCKAMFKRLSCWVMRRGQPAPTASANTAADTARAAAAASRMRNSHR